MRQYASSYTTWIKYCESRQWDPFLVESRKVVSFLQFLLETTKQSYGSFNTHRSALALIAEDDLAQDKILKRFLRAVYKIRPPAAKYETTWDPDRVLKYLVSTTDSSLAFLSKKLATLLLLASGQRLQTILSITINNLHFSDEHVTIFVPQLLKTSRPGGVAPTIVLPYLSSQPSLCVPSCIKLYLQKTSTFRQSLGSGDGSQMLLCIAQPHRPISGATLGRWVKDMLKAAGIDISKFTAYSTRHAAVSAAARRGVPLDTIFSAAGWSQKSRMFMQVYNRPLTSQGEFASAIMNTETILS